MRAHILDILKRYGVKATLFCTDPVENRHGHELAIHPNFHRNDDMVREILADPRQIEARRGTTRSCIEPSWVG